MGNMFKQFEVSKLAQIQFSFEKKEWCRVHFTNRRMDHPFVLTCDKKHCQYTVGQGQQ